MAKKLYIKSGGVAYDAMLHNIYRKLGTNAILFREGDLVKGGSVAYPVLRENNLSLGVRTSGSTNMTFTYSFNNTLKSNPIVVMMGSSHCVSLNLNPPDRLQDKLQAYFNANWGGATIYNIGVPGEYSNHFLPTSMGGLSDRNIDKALSYNPDIILYIAPTNDPQYNTPAQATANIQIIRDYARQHSAKIFIHSPMPRGDYNATLQQALADSDPLWQKAFTYEYFPMFNSELRDKTSILPAQPNLAYFQSDTIHLTSAGTTVEANYIIPVLEYQLRANTAYNNFIIQRSSDGSTGWTVFDTILNQNTIKKTYPYQNGYYRVTATLKDNTTLPYSNIVNVPVIPPANTTSISFSKTSSPQAAGWLNLTGDPAVAIATITDPSTGFTVSTTASTNWNPLGGSNSQNGFGATTDDGGGFFFPAQTVLNYFYNYSQVYDPLKWHIEISNLNQAKQYTIKTMASRGTGGTPNPPYSTAFTLKDKNGTDLQNITNSYLNTSKGVTFINKVPDTNGKLHLYVNYDGSGQTGHINGIQIIEQ